MVQDASERAKRRKQWWSEHNKKPGKNREEVEDKEEVKVIDIKKTDTSFSLKDVNLVVNDDSKISEDIKDAPIEELSDEKEIENPEKIIKKEITKNTGSELTKSQKRRLRNKKTTDNKDAEDNEIKPSQIKEVKIKKKKKHRGSKNKNVDKDKLFTLYVGGMGPDTNKDEIRAHFGDKLKENIEAIRLLSHKDSNKSKGLAFVDFKTKEFMKEALKLNKSVLFKKTITVQLPVPGKKAEKGPNPLRKPKNSNEDKSESQT